MIPPLEQTVREVGKILRLAKGQLHIQHLEHSNWELEGPLNVPLHPIAIAALYPTETGDPEYRMIGLTKGAEEQVREFRERILRYTLRPEVQTFQRELITVWRMMSHLHDRVIRAHGVVARANGIPLTFIIFGQTAEGKQPTAHIYHPSTLPTEVCLRMMQGAVTAVTQSEN